jgi:23S rRNA (cytidine1920-2'-O)/16S rRNA (cytidine1409-2'-O)-methyltransferase
VGRTHKRSLVANDTKMRLDRRLVEAGLVVSRARAADFVRRGCVTVAGEIVLKPAAMVAGDVALALSGDAGTYVSRGALKLDAALHAFGLDPKGCAVLDVGASTGGFTEVLLAGGAAKVFAVDVGREQLHESLRADPRVVSLEATDARTLDAAIVADVSFISLTQALPVPLKLAASDSWLVALVKPQFEAGREAVGRGGIVRDEKDRERSVTRVHDFLEGEGWRVFGVIQSPIEGGSGNIEYLIGARRGA